MKGLKKYSSTLAAVIVVGVLAGCQSWPDIKTPPVNIDPVVAVDNLYEALKPQIDKAPKAKEIVRKVLTQVRSKLPLLADGEITVNEAFAEALAVTPSEFKPFVIGLQLAFNAYYGDYGKQIPEEQVARIKIIQKIVNLLEGKLKQ